jgi:hypothetical protein
MNSSSGTTTTTTDQAPSTNPARMDGMIDSGTATPEPADDMRVGRRMKPNKEAKMKAKQDKMKMKSDM